MKEKRSTDLEDYKKNATIIVEEYFATDDVVATINELRELGKPEYSYYFFLKKPVSMSMDKHYKEKEISAILLSALFVDTFHPSQVYKGFNKLVEPADDLIIDIPAPVKLPYLLDGILFTFGWWMGGLAEGEEGCAIRAMMNRERRVGFCNFLF